MLPYRLAPAAYLKGEDGNIASFLKQGEQNIDWDTIHSFGEEWKKFNSFSNGEIRDVGNDYFDVVTDEMVNQNTVALDVGCGSGRWMSYIAPKVKHVEGIDPSASVITASKFLKHHHNVRLTQASVENIPFEDQSFDFIYGLGVFHHLPDTLSAIRRCYEKLKPGGWFLIYLYYNLENRPFLYKAIFKASDLLRSWISRLPGKSKRLVCDSIATLVYWPLSKLSSLLSVFSDRLADQVPLAYYRKTSFHIMRNDALDRFGTPVEKRFSKAEISMMLASAGFGLVRFSNKPPYWHAVAQKN